MSNRSYLVPRPPAFDHEHPRPKEEGEYKVPPNTCFEPSLPPTLVYILGKEAE